jgi:mannose-1-phosphate guanylyltransferase
MSRNATHTIILAAGEGRRLADLTRRLHGDDRPKQFAIIRGERSLLQETVGRMAAVSRPEEMTVIVGQRQEALAREQLIASGLLDLVVQPRNVGTAPGVLLPLARVLARSPDAEVVITPSDHHFKRPDRFVGRLSYARAAAAASPSGVCLMAVEAEFESTDLGWVVPGAPLPERPGACLIDGFVEKPDPVTARRLFHRGALWNTFVMVGSARRLWSLAARRLPGLVRLFEDYLRSVGTERESEVLRRVYDVVEAADFSADVLAGARGLAVVSIGGCGWSDWGTPERIFASLDGTPDRIALERRCGQSSTYQGALTTAMREWPRRTIS